MKTFLCTFGLAVVLTFSLASTAEDQPFKVGDRVTMKFNMAEHLLVSHVYSWNDRKLGDTLPLIFNGELYHVYGGLPRYIEGTNVICRMKGSRGGRIEDGTELELTVSLAELNNTGVVLMVRNRDIFAGGIYCSKGRHSFYEERNRFYFPTGLVKLMHDPADTPLSVEDLNQAFGRYVEFSAKK